jgi:hypothetical protein
VVHTRPPILERTNAQLHVRVASCTLACVPFPRSSLSSVEYRDQLLAHVQLTSAVADATSNPRAGSCVVLCGRLQLLGPDTSDQGQQQKKQTLHRDMC